MLYSRTHMAEQWHQRVKLHLRNITCGQFLHSHDNSVLMTYTSVLYYRLRQHLLTIVKHLGSSYILMTIVC